MIVVNKDRLLEVARQLVDEGRLDRAIKEYEKILDADPDDLRVKIMLAELQVRRKKVVEAISLYKEVAASYEADGFFLKAVTIYKNIIRLNPSLIEINEKLALLYEKMGLIPDAVRQYEILAVSLEQQGLWDRILEIRKRISDLKPNDGSARIRLAEIYQRQGMPEEAIDQYEIYSNQLAKKGDEEKLAEMYERILPHRPENKQMLKSLVDIYYKRNENKKAIKWLESESNYVDQDKELLKLKAKIYVKFNQMETARKHYMMLADLLIEDGEIDKAVKVLEEICFIDPGEEDDISERIEELKPGSWKEISLRLAERRKRAEDEGREEDTDTGSLPGYRDEEIEVKTKPKDEVRKEEKPSEKPKIESQKEKKESTTTPLVEMPHKKETSQKTEQKIVGNCKDAEAAIGLGKTYWKMGLHSEAKDEWKRAKEIYESLMQSDSKWKVNVMEVAKLLDQNDDDKSSKEEIVEKKSESTQKETKEEEKPKKKSKISYV